MFGLYVNRSFNEGFFVKTAMNIIAYFVYIDRSPSNSGNDNQEDFEGIDSTGLRIMSSMFLLLDATTTFFLQFAMIYIPYLW